MRSKKNIRLGLIIGSVAIWTSCANNDPTAERLDLAVPAKDTLAPINDLAMSAQEQSADECDDGIDNDNDQRIDCDDPSCQDSAPCKGSGKDFGVNSDQRTSGPDGCVPQCAGKSCGPDGCSGECGPGCEDWQSCTAAGHCLDVQCVAIGEECPWGVGPGPECCDTAEGHTVSCKLQTAKIGVCCIIKSFACSNSSQCCSGFTCKLIDGISHLTCQP